MKKQTSKARETRTAVLKSRGKAALFFSLLLSTGCDSLLTVETPGEIQAATLDNPKYAQLLATSALSSFECAFGAYILTAGALGSVVVAEIVEAVRHPQAEKLQVCKVKAAQGELLQIVCGAANARAGLKTALAMVGAKLPGDKQIAAAKLRGVDSAGMLCSSKELGLADASEGILELPADSPAGADLRAFLGLDDEILELNVTPNRGDAMSILGIAREVAALTRGSVKMPQPMNALALKETYPVKLGAPGMRSSGLGSATASSAASAAVSREAGLLKCARDAASAPNTPSPHSAMLR